MKTYLINLHNAYDRRVSAVAELVENNVNHEIFYGMDNNRFKLRSGVPHLSTGAIGAFVSHYSVLLNAAQISDELVLILEDDIKLEHDFLAKLQQVVQKLPENWEIAFLGWFLQRNGTADAGGESSPWIQVKGSLGMYSYLVKRTSIHKILSQLFHIHNHVDIQVVQAIERHRLAGYWLKEKLVWCKDFPSQIEK